MTVYVVELEYQYRRNAVMGVFGSKAAAIASVDEILTDNPKAIVEVSEWEVRP